MTALIMLTIVSCREHISELSQGDELSPDGICIRNVHYDKTSLAVVIPHGLSVCIKNDSDASWDKIVTERTDELWHGVFINGRNVTLSPFAMGKYPVTQELYVAVMGDNPSHFVSGDAALRPVETVTWFNAVVFCNVLTQLTMKQGDCAYYSDIDCEHVYTAADAESRVIPFLDRTRTGYRLPTEAEWEFAARGGAISEQDWQYAFSGSPTHDAKFVYDGDSYLLFDKNLDQYGWYIGNAGGTTHPVGTKLPNRLGIYDMSGNVWEWLWDWYDNHIYVETVTNPTGAKTGTDRVLRGGSWFDHAFTGSVTRRFHNAHPYIPHFYFGFRICRSL